MLPDALLPSEFYEQYKDVARIDDAEEKKVKTVELISKIPQANRVCSSLTLGLTLSGDLH